MSSLLRGGRLTRRRADVVNFISSSEADRRITRPTVLVNEAHVVALQKSRAIQSVAAKKILRALRHLEQSEPPTRGVEDVHVAIEEAVTRRTGTEVGGLLHLGKSRNDQVVTAVRITLRDGLLDLSDLLIGLELCLIRLAKRHQNTVFPGYTHLQPAQPISFGHYLIANCFSLIRDSERLTEAYSRINQSPMGAAAIAGTSVPLDRHLVAKLLGFEGLVEASLDAVGGRDFALEALAVLALTANDLSRISTDLIFYSSSEVGLVELPDEFASTSSIMPQKKNADPLELIRAKAAKVAGIFSSAVSLMHGLTSGYNLDYQEITPMLWESVDEVAACVRVLAALTPRLRIDALVASRAYLDFTAATELANLLVRMEHMPFRTAHQRVGALVRSAVKDGKTLRDLQRTDWQAVLGYRPSGRLMKLISQTLDLTSNIHSYRTYGSPSPRETKRLISHASARCRDLQRTNDRARRRVEESMRMLRRMSGTILSSS